LNESTAHSWAMLSQLVCHSPLLSTNPVVFKLGLRLGEKGIDTAGLLSARCDMTVSVSAAVLQAPSAKIAGAPAAFESAAAFEIGIRLLAFGALKRQKLLDDLLLERIAGRRGGLSI
jgi:hypothetical protein